MQRRDLYNKATGSYAVFAGRITDRAMCKGSLEDKDMVEDIDGCDAQELEARADWLNHYRNKYRVVGKLKGSRFLALHDATTTNDDDAPPA